MNFLSRPQTAVSIAEAKANFSHLLKRVEAGEEVLITRHGKPVAVLVPPANQERQLPRIGALKGKIWISDDFDKLGPEWESYQC